MREDLIERLREYAQADDLHKDERDTLIAAAAALEAAREESDRWRDRYRAAIDQARGKGIVPEQGEGERG